LSTRRAAESGLLNLKVTLLGTGTSYGVPMIGCDCPVCRSTDPRDRRMRTSILIELPEAGEGGAPRTQSSVAGAVRHILVDTSSDLRAQALTFGVRRIDAILFTHSHADHVLGLDEVRRFNKLQREAIPCYADARTLADLRRTFSYIFDADTPRGGGIPKIVLNHLAGPFTLGGVEIVPVPIMHGSRPILGFRLGSFAYLTDCSAIPDGSWPLLAGVETLVLDALRERAHSTHFSVPEAVAAAARIGAARTYFTHISHDLPHEATCARLPRGVELAYDGLVLEIPDDERRDR
jgi:phosphoribosyl 1,2-cyclic phosphate phosphodiesterase